LAGNAFEIERAASREFKSSASDKIGDNARYKNLVRTGLRHHARGGVHGDPTDISASHLDLAGVQPRAQRETDLLRSGAEGERASHRTARSVEGCENAVACAFHEIPAMLLDGLLRQTIVTIEQFVPALISDLHCHTSRVDDIGKENGRQNPIRLGSSAIAMSGDKFLDIAHQPLAMFSKARAMGKIVVLDVFCAGIAVASFRPSATGTTASARLCSTSAGTRTLGRTDVTSIRRFINISVLNAPGLHDRRSSLPNSAISRSFPSRVPSTRFIDTPVPHAATLAVTKASNASSDTDPRADKPADKNEM
jgi:hypothetical protein